MTDAAAPPDFSSPPSEPTGVPAPKLPTKMTVRNFIDGDKLKADASYSTLNMNDAYQQQGGLMADYTAQAAKAAKQVDDLEIVLEATEATLYRKLREEAVKNSEKLTEVQLEKAIIVQPRIISLKRAIAEAKQVEAIAKGAVKAIENKKDMLVQQGADNRKERDGEMRMRGGGDASGSFEEGAARYMRRVAAE